MNISRLISFIGLSFALIGNASGQSFQNLDFELADTSGYSPNSDIPVANGFSDWSVSYSALGVGTNIASVVTYDGISLGGAFASINDVNTGFGFAPIQGNYSAYLFGGPSDIFSPSNPTYTTISQTGVVPNGTKSLLVDVYGGSFVVTLGGQTISMMPLLTFSNYTLYGGDISSFAGLGTQLSITAPPTGVPNGELIDNIVFSPSSVPEPSTLSLFSICILFICWVIKRPNKRIGCNGNFV